MTPKQEQSVDRLREAHRILSTQVDLEVCDNLKAREEAVIDQLSQTQSALEQAQRDLADAKVPTIQAECALKQAIIERDKAQRERDERVSIETYEDEHKKRREIQQQRDELQAKCDSLARELVSHREKAQGNYWAWQGDGEDHIESLVYNCPVVIHAHALKEILDRCAKLEAACAEMREALEYCGCHEHTESPCDESGSHYKDLCEFCQKVDKALSATCGQAFLDERERMRKALEFYADERNYGVMPGTHGDKAREALKEK